MATELMQTTTDFTNEPLTDFADPENARMMREALDRMQARLGASYPLIIGDREVHEGDLSESVNPARPTQVVGRFVDATVREVETAMQVAQEAFESWRHRSWEDRADVLFRAAAAMRERRFDLAAVMVYEVSKSWL